MYFVSMKIFIPVLLFFMVIQSFGHLLVFKVQQSQVRREIKQQIKAGVAEKDLVLLKIPKAFEENSNSVFQRIHSKEFRYKGNMYDIIRQRDHGDTTWYYCIADVKESGLFASLESRIRFEMTHNAERKEQSEQVLRLLTGFYCNDFDNTDAVYFKNELPFTYYNFTVKTWHPLPITPPPQV